MSCISKWINSIFLTFAITSRENNVHRISKFQVHIQLILISKTEHIAFSAWILTWNNSINLLKCKWNSSFGKNVSGNNNYQYSCFFCLRMRINRRHQKTDKIFDPLTPSVQLISITILKTNPKSGIPDTYFHSPSTLIMYLVLQICQLKKKKKFTEKLFCL